MIRVRYDRLWCLATLEWFKAIISAHVLRIQGCFVIVELSASETDQLQKEFQANFFLKARSKGKGNENYSQMLIFRKDNVTNNSGLLEIHVILNMYLGFFDENSRFTTSK